MAENAHDKFFKDNFSRQDIARAFVEETFPASLLEKLRLDTFTLSNASYIDTTLEEYFADIVYTCQYGAQSVQIAILFEHKSYKETYPHFQLLRYLLNSWEQARKQKQPPTLLIPVIIYHGRAAWEYEPLPAYFGEVDAGLIRFLPDFEYLLVNISRYSDEQILSFQNRFLATSLFLMKHRTNEERLLAQRDRLFVWLENEVNPERESDYLQTAVVYLFRNLDFRSRTFYDQLFSSPQNNRKAMSTYDYLLSEGRKEGRKEGREEGRMEGRTEIVTKLFRVAHEQGMDITRLLTQDYGLSNEQLRAIVDTIQRGQ